MKNYNKKIKFSHSSFLFLLVTVVSCGSVSAFLEPDGDAVAQPMIDKIELYKKNSGHYPATLMKLIPKYIPRYDFQAFHYEYNTARGEKLDAFIKKGLITKGQGEGYLLRVRFQKYTGECTYVNGERKSCRYIGR